MMDQRFSKIPAAKAGPLSHPTGDESTRSTSNLSATRTATTVEPVAPRPVQPTRARRPRKQAQPDKPVKHDWHDDQPFRPSSIPRQLSKRRITRDRVDYPRLLATYFTKSDEDVLLPVDARDVALADATVSEPLQYAGDAVVAGQSEDDFDQATTMLYPDDMNTTQDSGDTQSAVTTVHDKSDDDVESTVADESTPVTVSADEPKTMLIQLLVQCHSHQVNRLLTMKGPLWIIKLRN